jgi:hypothetical protein
MHFGPRGVSFALDILEARVRRARKLVNEVRPKNGKLTASLEAINQ